MHPVIADRFCLKDEDYWSDPWRTRKTLQRGLMQKGDEGLVLGTPGTVALNEHADFPAALIRVARLPTFARLPTSSALILAVLDLYTGELRARLAIDAVARPPAAPGAPAGAKDSFSGDDSAMLSEGHTVDLATRLQLPASRREYLVTAILLDKPSNRSRMKVAESAGYEDPAVDDFVRERLASRMPLAEVTPAAGEPLPSYKAGEQSLAPPDAVGINLSVPRVSVFGADEPCIVRGSFRLPVLAQHRVKPADAKEGEPPPPAPEDTARVPISLLLTGSVDHAPQVLKLVVPVYEPLGDTDGKTDGQVIATGHFCFDLCGMPGMNIRPQTYFIYAFAGEVMTAAVPAAFTRLPAEVPETAPSW